MLQKLFVLRRVSGGLTTGSGRVMIDAIANSPAKPILRTVRIQHLSCYLSVARWLKRRLAQGLCILALSTTSALYGDLRAGRVEGCLAGGPQRDSVGFGGGRGDSAMPRGRGPDPGPRGGGASRIHPSVRWQRRGHCERSGRNRGVPPTACTRSLRRRSPRLGAGIHCRWPSRSCWRERTRTCAD